MRVFHTNVSWWFSTGICVTVKSPQVSGTLLSILADLNNAVVWIVSSRALISNSLIPFTNLLGTVPRAPIIIGITVTFMFHSLFSSQARSWYLSLFSSSFNFYLWSAGTAKFTIRQVRFFCGLSLDLVEIRRSVCISKSLRSLCVSFSKTDSGLCKCHLCVWSNLNVLHSSLVDHLPHPVVYYYYYLLIRFFHIS